ncbi:type I-B CRISPR-associated protein Cas7/Csh2 [Diplocloster modestus]|uniref:Type I-B CRISPR-associated protein Cas7/Csh2 n=1 Tax=Diplocloster modestus TaxID=2850322 RepID=A0ABS6K2Y5_9FIRM|nr:type I-B CRISPR-associated protein Cas7/Csh2 [Diplocloster modestus]MBU9724872.1 type I-B CRISPR-associated protein Cas7/Csh2 [Diplocloster modestus]
MNNSEILFLYDAKLTNPNGDPDEENRPRMDYERGINMVSDLRLKRYVRDYLADQGYPLFVQKMDGSPVTAETRIKKLGTSNDQEILDQLIDVRLFGATMPIAKDNKQFIGPVQFNWGYSLNTVKVLESSITSTFASSDNNKQGAIGKDFRVAYSFIAFSGVISANRGKATSLKEEDIAELDRALRYAIPLQVTRSKIGQYPRLYLRVEYKSDMTILGDMRDYISLKEKTEDIRDISETALEVGKLVDFLKENIGKIDSIHYFCDSKCILLNHDVEVTFQQAFDGFTLIEVE